MISADITHFFVEPPAVEENRLSLTGPEAFHCASVLRHKVGDRITCVDGQGYTYTVEIVQVKKGLVAGKILHRTVNRNEPKIKVTLAQGVTKVSKFDWVIEKGTEIGVSAFLPLLTEKSVAKRTDLEVWAQKAARLKRVALAAMKQSLRSVCPAILPPVKVDELARRLSDYDLSLLASFRPDAQPIFQIFSQRPSKPNRILLTIGPESGLSPREEDSLLSSGVVPVSLGPRRLRTETAGLVLASQVLGWAGD